MPRCGRAKKNGFPCQTVTIIPGEACWRHRGDPDQVEIYRVPVVRAFKCPHCGGLTEVTDERI